MNKTYLFFSVTGLAALNEFYFFFHSVQQFHQAGEPVFHLHKHMAHSCWIHTFGKWTDVTASGIQS